VSLKLFGITDVDGGFMSRRVALGVSKNLSGKGLDVLVIDSVGDCHGHFKSIPGDGYVQFGSTGASNVSMNLAELNDEFLLSSESVYDVLIVVMKEVVYDSISPAVKMLPVAVIVQMNSQSSIKKTKGLVTTLLNDNSFSRPASFITDSGNRLLDARLVRSLYIPSWGSVGDIEHISERVLSHSTVYEIGRAGNANNLLREDHPTLNAKDVPAVQRDGAIFYGPLNKLICDPEITEVMVNGSDEVYIERRGGIYKTDVCFRDDEELLSLIERMVSKVNRRIDESSPMVDARMGDGSRLNAAIKPISIDGPVLTIRRFVDTLKSIDDLISLGMLTMEVADFIAECVDRKVSMVISGGTSSGKTTLLGILTSFVSPNERIVTIEDSAELHLMANHVVRLEARPPNIEGAGEIAIRELVKNALRMRPDRIVVGECRGAEALDMLQAMNTGHEGSLTTVHANSTRDVISRLETMILMANVALPLKAVRQQIVSSVKMIIHLARDDSGVRRVVQIAELTGIEGETPSMQILADIDCDGSGLSRLTGLKPKFFEGV
jgi:pilus assembly protein CpaF